MRQERPEHTLQPSAVVNEAWLRMVGGRKRNWENRSHFMAAAAHTMRLLLVDYGRRRNARKRGGPALRIDMEAPELEAHSRIEEMIAIDQALSRLEQWDARQSQVVELRIFGGLTEDEISRLLGVTSRTVKRDWQMAKAWLYGELHPEPRPAEISAGARPPEVGPESKRP
jgi:RNA polymerase sigma factor (TIGR02999 family)